VKRVGTIANSLRAACRNSTSRASVHYDIDPVRAEIFQSRKTRTESNPASRNRAKSRDFRCIETLHHSCACDGQ